MRETLEVPHAMFEQKVLNHSGRVSHRFNGLRGEVKSDLESVADLE
jgi:hypothetical protein